MSDDGTDRNDLPPYSYVPGGPWPHPFADPGGHSRGRRGGPVPSIEGDAWYGAPDYLRGFRLFNAGYYWEAHEAWEGLWHAHGRRGPSADLLRALIKLAAAGVKVREGQSHGVRVHALRAAELFAGLRRGGPGRQLGLDLEVAEAFARRAAETTTTDAADLGSVVSVVFGERLEPSR